MQILANKNSVGGKQQAYVFFLFLTSIFCET